MSLECWCLCTTSLSRSRWRRSWHSARKPCKGQPPRPATCPQLGFPPLLLWGSSLVHNECSHIVHGRRRGALPNGPATVVYKCAAPRTPLFTMPRPRQPRSFTNFISYAAIPIPIFRCTKITHIRQASTTFSTSPPPHSSPWEGVQVHPVLPPAKQGRSPRFKPHPTRCCSHHPSCYCQTPQWQPGDTLPNQTISLLTLAW